MTFTPSRVRAVEVTHLARGEGSAILATYQLTMALMTFNEIEGLQPTVAELIETLRAQSITFEMLIIDDGSSDGCAELADRLAETYPEVRVIHHPENQGLGEVYRTGFRHSRGEWITFFPADGEIPADCLPAFLQAMPDNDLLLGVIPQIKRPWHAILLTLCEKSLYYLLFGPFPPFQGIFMVRLEEVRRHRLRSPGRSWVNLKELIIRATRGGCRYRCVPTSLRRRYGGVSKVRNLRTILVNLVHAFRLRAWMLGEQLGLS